MPALAAHVRQPVFLLLGTAAVSGWLLLPLLRHAPNRLLSGRSLGLSALGWPAGVVVAASLALLAVALLRRSRASSWAALAAGWALASGYLAAAGAASADLAAHSPDAARTSFGAGGWLVLVTGLLVQAEATRALRLPPLGRLAIFAVAALGLALPVAFGWLDQLSLAREWRAKQDVFGDALWRHGVIVLGALAPTLAIGLPLGVLAHRSIRFRGPLLSALSLIQTIPSIALFGLLMAPLTALGEALPYLRDLGIRGVGLTPAILALTLYALLPIVRNMVSGFDSTPAAVLEAARGQGMTNTQVFFQVEAPLAAPVLLAGLRITVVQTIGLAAVAALIGAGGLGALMFQGLFANAADLILLGATPIVALAVAADVLFRLAAEGLRAPA
jgi:osmoprotectant transport system permease protein